MDGFEQVHCRNRKAEIKQMHYDCRKYTMNIRLSVASNPFLLWMQPLLIQPQCSLEQHQAWTDIQSLKESSETSLMQLKRTKRNFINKSKSPWDNPVSCSQRLPSLDWRRRDSWVQHLIQANKELVAVTGLEEELYSNKLSMLMMSTHLTSA